jgi:LPLT family lysophospholipid transporter-like MFS transporter
VAWVPLALGITDLSMAANMNGAVAIGIALGAAAASFVSLNKVNRALPAGILIGLLIIAFAQSTSLHLALALLVLIGACGGFYVVPLNALLQVRGQASTGTGHAVAVQNFFENCAMLSLVGLYTLMDKGGISVIRSATIFGGVVLVAIFALAVSRLNEK